MLGRADFNVERKSSMRNVSYTQTGYAQILLLGHFPDIQIRDFTYIRVAANPRPTEGALVVRVRLRTKLRIHFELRKESSADEPGDSWVFINRARECKDRPYIGDTIETSRPVHKDEAVRLMPGYLIILGRPVGPKYLLGFQAIFGSASSDNTVDNNQGLSSPSTSLLRCDQNQGVSEEADTPPLHKRARLEFSGRSDNDCYRELECAICHEVMYKPVSVTPCMHTFCSSCLSVWLEKHGTCPLCRLAIGDAQLNRTVGNLIEDLIREGKIRDYRTDKDRTSANKRDSLGLTKYDMKSMSLRRARLQQLGH